MLDCQHCGKAQSCTRRNLGIPSHIFHIQGHYSHAKYRSDLGICFGLIDTETCLRKSEPECFCFTIWSHEFDKSLLTDFIQNSPSFIENSTIDNLFVVTPFPRPYTQVSYSYPQLLVCLQKHLLFLYILRAFLISKNYCNWLWKPICNVCISTYLFE